MNYTPNAALAALSDDELVVLLATYQPLWHVLATLQQRGPSVIDAALRGLDHAHPQVRRWCAELMDTLGDDRCTEPLLALFNDPVAHVRWQAAHSLGCQRCKRAPLDIQRHVAERMAALIMSDPSTRVRTMALSALDLRPEVATPALLETLRGYETDLSTRAVLSKRERAFLRALGGALKGALAAHAKNHPAAPDRACCDPPPDRRSPAAQRHRPNPAPPDRS